MEETDSEQFLSLTLTCRKMLRLVMSIFLWFSALSLAPFPSLPGRQAVTHIPEVPSQPVYPTGPCRAHRDLENLASCLQLRIQNLSPQDKSTEEYPR